MCMGGCTGMVGVGRSVTERKRACLERISHVDHIWIEE